MLGCLPEEGGEQKGDCKGARVDIGEKQEMEVASTKVTARRVSSQIRDKFW